MRQRKVGHRLSGVEAQPTKGSEGLPYGLDAPLRPPHLHSLSLGTGFLGRNAQRMENVACPLNRPAAKPVGANEGLYPVSKG